MAWGSELFDLYLFYFFRLIANGKGGDYKLGPVHKCIKYIDGGWCFFCFFK